MNGYIAIYNGKQIEIRANTKLEAFEQAMKELKVPKSKRGLLAVVLAEVNGKPVLQSTAF